MFGNWAPSVHTDPDQLRRTVPLGTDTFGQLRRVEDRLVDRRAVLAVLIMPSAVDVLVVEENGHSLFLGSGRHCWSHLGVIRLTSTRGIKNPRQFMRTTGRNDLIVGGDVSHCH